MEMLPKLPDCQIMPASSEQSYMLFHLPLLSFAVVKRRILLFFSDSVSTTLEAVNGFKLEIDIAQNIIKDYTHLAKSGKTIILCWIPSHVNIRCSERANTAAKSTLSLPITKMKIPARELTPYVSKFCLDEWQDTWDHCESNKLHSIYPTVGIFKHSKNMSHYDSVLLNRLRIGHSRLTHSYLLYGDDPPTCQSCGISLTVKHISGMYQLAGHL